MKLSKKNLDQPEDKARLRRESLQLRRLARMVDVVYAIIIWRIFTLLPRPTAEQLSWEHIGGFLSVNIGGFLLVIIGIVFTIIYWIQNNVLFGNLQSTDGRHTILSILQLFFYWYFWYPCASELTWGHPTAPGRWKALQPHWSASRAAGAGPMPSKIIDCYYRKLPKRMPIN